MPCLHSAPLSLSLIALLALSACGKAAVPGGQVVAIVDGQEITRSQLNAALPTGPVGNDANAKAIRNATLDRLIARQLIVEEAKRQKIDHTEEYLAATRRADDEILTELFTRHTLQNIRTPYAKDVSAFVLANPTRFAERTVMGVDQISFSTGSIDAAALRNAHSLDAVIALLKAKNIRYQRGNAAIDSAQLDPAAYHQIDSLPAGEPFVVQEGGSTLVSVIISRNKSPVPPEKTNDLALQILRQQGAREALEQQMKTFRANAAIQYGEGFGPITNAPKPQS